MPKKMARIALRDRSNALWQFIQKFHGSDFPEMIKLGQLYFTLAVHTAGCERGFSVQNSTLTPSRNRLQEATQDTLMRVRLGPEAHKSGIGIIYLIYSFHSSVKAHLTHLIFHEMSPRTHHSNL